MKAEDKKPSEEVKKDEEVIDCPINFERLTMGALRKYQYRYKLNMGEDEKNVLITREQLITAIKRHFVKELKVDEPELIAKFLSLKKEERDRPMRGLNGANQRNHRPRREGRKTTDFTPSNPGGGQGSLAQANARHTTPFNPGETAKGKN